MAIGLILKVFGNRNIVNFRDTLYLNTDKTVMCSNICNLCNELIYREMKSAKLMVMKITFIKNVLKKINSI